MDNPFYYDQRADDEAKALQDDIDTASALIAIACMLVASILFWVGA